MTEMKTFKPPSKHVAWVNEFQRQMGRIPTIEEVRALQFVQHNYRDWRKRFTEPLADFMARMPKGSDREAWRGVYFHPFGALDWNQHISTVRRLLAGEVE